MCSQEDLFPSLPCPLVDRKFVSHLFIEGGGLGCSDGVRDDGGHVGIFGGNIGAGGLLMALFHS